MTLYKFLIDQMAKYASESMHNIRDDKEFYKSLGKCEMCKTLINELSDETLKTEVITRHESLKKGE